VTDTNRRTITKMLGLGTVCSVPLATVSSLLPNVSSAAALVDPASEKAKGLQYTGSSETDGSSCSVCALFQGGEAETGPCPLFAGEEVKATGLCSAFVPKA